MTSSDPEKPFVGVAAVVVAAVDPFLADLKKLAVKDLNVGVSKTIISRKKKNRREFLLSLKLPGSHGCCQGVHLETSLLCF